jgi:putative SOS response-associated peptidase YedK
MLYIFATLFNLHLFYTGHMCGRYRRRSDKQRIAEAFAVGTGLEDLYLEPEDDIAPGSMQPVVLMSQDGERAIALMRWGFKLPDRLLFNARSEGIEQATFWKDSFLERRCIVPADSIFEWKAVERGKKPKYEIAVPGSEPFGMAGVWKVWMNPKTQQWEKTFAVLTGEPNELVQPIHSRMTTILERRDYAEYLAPADRPPLHLLRILPKESMRAAPLHEESTAIPAQLGLFNMPDE